jgi:hypothetical protein
MPDALVLVIDPIAGIKDVEIVAPETEAAADAYSTAATPKPSRPVEAKPDPYQEAAIAELQTQIGLIAAKQ